jgi:hypothetical protein
MCIENSLNLRVSKLQDINGFVLYSVHKGEYDLASKNGEAYLPKVDLGPFYRQGI